ncbi:kinase C theta type, partial [Pelobates cultripes]
AESGPCWFLQEVVPSPLPLSCSSCTGYVAELKRTGKKRQREKTEEKKGPDGSETEEHLKRKKKCEEHFTGSFGKTLTTPLKQYNCSIPLYNTLCRGSLPLLCCSEKRAAQSPRGQGQRLRRVEISCSDKVMPECHRCQQQNCTWSEEVEAGAPEKPLAQKTWPSKQTLSPHSCLLPVANTYTDTVVLASDKITNKWLAMKIIDKQRLIESASSCLVERRVLEIAAGSKFLTHAYATFQTEVPTLLPYINPLFKQDRLFFAMDTTTDIKPDNILMDSVGHLKIADFGLALENMRGRKKAKEHAGTLGYIAPEFHPFPPEMLLGQRYNAAVDWWAFGVILYTMATGEFPFYCGNTRYPEKEWERGRDPGRDILLLFNVQEAATPATALLLKEPAMRLGRKGLIRSHSFFQSIDWEDLPSR